MAQVDQAKSSISQLLASHGGSIQSARKSEEDPQERFLKLLVTQMQNQDPLSPMDNAEVTSQLAQISTVNGIEKLNGTLEQLVANSDAKRSLEAATMIGRSVLVPQDQRSEGLLGLPELQDVAGLQVVVVRGNAGRELIKQSLSQRGALVRYVQSYSRIPLPLDGATLCQQWQQQGIRCVVATSNEILQRIFDLVPATQQSWLCQLGWILVSPRARDSALLLGIAAERIQLAQSANDDALLEAIQQFKKDLL